MAKNPKTNTKNKKTTVGGRSISARNRGITLISLIITIILLLILAGITINYTIGEKGIITHAKETSKQTEIANIKEEIQLKILNKQYENGGKISDNTLKEILQKYGTIDYQTDGITIKGITTYEKKYEILLANILNETIKEEQNPPTFTTVANAPNISGFNKSTTYYVAWTEGKDRNNNTIFNEDENLNNLNGIAPSNWYDYTAGVNKWANVKTTGGGNDCYWVWIPRYAYQVPDRNSGGETINIKFLKGTTNAPIDETSITISNNTTKGNWNVPPAFWWDKNNNGIEEEGEQLTGIWVAKFEASSSDVSVDTLDTDLATNGGGDYDTKQVRVKPNVTSWRGITVSNIFKVCQNMTTSGNSLANSTNIDTHMMKNTEWGAVAYLSYSIYGKNGPVWNNPWAYDNSTYYSNVTGRATKGNDGGIYINGNSTTNYDDVTDAYNIGNGSNASTTGNVYGVYDMAGGALEYVAAYFDNGTLHNTNTSLMNAESKYKDVYSEYSSNKYGDAIYETSILETNITTWGGNQCPFISKNYPVLFRGGAIFSAQFKGVFSFSANLGHAFPMASFRPCLVNSR